MLGEDAALHRGSLWAVWLPCDSLKQWARPAPGGLGWWGIGQRADHQPEGHCQYKLNHCLQTPVWMGHYPTSCYNLSSPKREGSLVAQTVKQLPVMRETWVQSLIWKDPLEKEMATHCSILAWKIPWMEEHGRLQFKGPQRVRHDWATSLVQRGRTKHSN